MIQKLGRRRPTLSSLNQTQNRRRYINLKNGSHFICSLNLNYNPELTVFITFKMTYIASENQSFFNSIIGNITERTTAKLITFYKTFGSLGLLISKAQVGSYIAIANDSSSLIPEPNSKFQFSKSICTDLSKWHLISVTWAIGKDLNNCWCNAVKLITTGNIKGPDHCYIGDLCKIPGWSNTHLTGCIGQIVAFQRILTDEETLYIHQHLMRK